MPHEKRTLEICGVRFGGCLHHFPVVRKDVGSIWASMPAERLLPMAVISILVTGLKVGLIAGGILLLKWIRSKLKK